MNEQQNEQYTDDLKHVKKVVEACLLTANDALGLSQIITVFDNQLSEDILTSVIAEISEDYSDTGVELINIASGYRFRSRPTYQHYLNKLYNNKPPRYSRAIMETLAIIVYRQPVTRGEIESLRGVSVNSNIIQLLFDRNWIEVVGHKQLPGKPELLATTAQFLDDMGINSLEQLPPLVAIDEKSIPNEQDLIAQYDSQKEVNNDNE